MRPGQELTTQFQGRDLVLRSLVSAHALELRNSTLGLLAPSVISNALRVRRVKL